VLSGGYFPNGSVTFTLVGPGGFTYSQSDSVNGNGTYTASTTLPTSGTVAGTYTWSATYSGDANNNSTSETGNSTNGEQTVVSPSSVLLSTVPNLTVITLGPSVTPRASDSAVLAGGYNPTGTITFRLFHGITLVDTETVSVNGDGTYTTPNGFSIPTSGTVTGLYQWDASYSGDANNNPLSDNDNVDEQVL